MSTALLSAPMTHEVKEPVIKPKKAFKAQHQAAVKRDCTCAEHKRSYRKLVVTPKRINLRRPDKSFVYVDLTADCKQLKWLMKLYRKECPTGMTVRFAHEIMYDAACGDHLEDIYMLVVIFDLRQS